MRYQCKNCKKIGLNKWFTQQQNIAGKVVTKEYIGYCNDLCYRQWLAKIRKKKSAPQRTSKKRQMWLKKHKKYLQEQHRIGYRKKYLNTENSILTLKNYKDPLLKIPKSKGFGYYGALSCTTDGDFLQCHVCGELFHAMGRHAFGAHKLNAHDYREKFQLQHTTALISENERMRMKQRTLDWLKTLSEEEIAEHRRQALEGRKFRGYHQPTERLEAKNKKGTCPQQLIEKIQEVEKKLGHTPSLVEFIDVTGGVRYKHLILKVYGTWLNALKFAKLTPKEHVTTKGMRHRKHTDEELLEYIRIFAQDNNKIPTHTDAKRGLIPNAAIYMRRFGSLPKARELAEIDQWL